MAADNSAGTKVDFYNLRIDILDRYNLFEQIQQKISSSETISINFLNANCFNIAQQNTKYRDAINAGTYLLNDGIGIDIAGRLIGVTFRENLNGTDLIPQLLNLAATNNLSVFCYGASDKVIGKAVRNICKANSAVSIVGYSNGFVEEPNAITDFRCRLKAN